jgi:hypothetical protein
VAAVAFIGAWLTISYEPFNNLLGHCAYPLIGQHTAGRRNRSAHSH